jgi:type II secretory pathway predicted ATPase ExeA
MSSSTPSHDNEAPRAHASDHQSDSQPAPQEAGAGEQPERKVDPSASPPSGAGAPDSGAPSQARRPDEHWAETVVFPLIRELRGLSIVSDALDRAAVHRRGVPVIGPAGSGKSYSLRHARTRFAALERARQRADRAYRCRRVLDIGLLRTRRYDDLLVHMITALLGAPPAVSVRGRRKREDELRDEFLTRCLEDNVAVLTVEDGEHVADTALELFRDLMSEAERMAAERRGGASTNGSAPLGLGIVLLATPALLPRLVTSTEAGQRWFPVTDVPPVDHALVAAVYAVWFPGFTPAITRMGGEEPWRAFVDTALLKGRPTPIRTVEKHAREYVRYMARRNPAFQQLADVPFDRDVFVRIWGDQDRDNSRGDA